MEYPQFLKQLSKLIDPLYIVGGFVRNRLLSAPVSDIDICSPMTAEQVLSALSGSEFACQSVYKATGTMCIVHKPTGQAAEYAMLRSESYVRGHTPSQVQQETDPKKDALRRDFTANAIYFHVQSQSFSDPCGGIEDIKNRTLRTVDDPARVFADDGLRVLRLVRQSAQLGFKPHPQTVEAAGAAAKNLKDISKERISAELMAILQADTAYPQLPGTEFAHERGVRMLIDLGAMEYIIPELLEGRGMAQRADFHRYDVLEHTLQVLKASPPQIRLAALLHDIAKPSRFLKTGKFAGHDTEGAQTAYSICRDALKLSRRECCETAELVRLHMVDLQGNMSEKKLRWFLAQHSGIMPKLLMLKQADYVGSGIKSDTAPSVIRFTQLLQRMRQEGAPFSLKELNISGKDVSSALGSDSISLTAAVLSRLWRRAAIDPTLNNRDSLLKLLPTAIDEEKQRAEHAAEKAADKDSI